MGRRRVKNKRQPSEYPQVAFRLSEARKGRLNRLIEQTQKRLNAAKLPEAPFWNRNDLIYAALELGIPRVKRHPDSRK